MKTDFIKRNAVEPLQIGPLLDSALEFLSKEWRHKVQIRLWIWDGVVVHAHREKMVHVFTNLLVNSLDALRRKKFRDAGEIPTISVVVRRFGNRNVILFHDNGEGIKPGVINKVFEPFFTTKVPSEGFGLGLTVCDHLVRKYGGRIAVRSERGKFCEFKLEFPVKE